MTRRPRGQLVIIGGRGDKDGDPAILDEFVRLAGGADARMAVTTVATVGRHGRHGHKRSASRRGRIDIHLRYPRKSILQWCRLKKSINLL